MNKKISFAILALTFLSCQKPQKITDSTNEEKSYKTENVIIVVVDGPRYSETWGDSLHQYQPRLANNLASEGIVYSNFFNNGVTYTNPGHAAITTGNYQELNNSGLELPENPSIFQYWLKDSGEDSTKAWLITSKDKLQVLANCQDSVWVDTFKPSTNCGVNGAGLGHGYRKDSLTFENVKIVLAKEQPNLMLVNFKEPDGSGHANDWDAYLKGIKDTDEYIYQLWNLIQSDENYANKTTLFVTNDHGRHLNGHKDGFISHGDSCIGCKHINLFAAGPDFNKNLVLDISREQIDISATTAKLLGINFSTGKGKVMDELFKN
jgi:predicted AlkP superfamily pyrophosphatase or phosphodiesterase